MLKRFLYHNFRVVYQISRWIRGRFTPAGMLVLGSAVASGIFGVNTRQTLAYQIFALTGAMLAMSLLFSSRFRERFPVQRRLPEFATVGEPLRYRVAVGNPTRQRQQDLCLMDELHSELPSFREFRAARDPEDRHRNWFDRFVGYPRLMGMLRRKRGASTTPVQVPPLAPLDRAEFDVTLTPVRRGYLRFRGPCLARPDPLGLCNAVQQQAATDELLVLPRLYRAPRIELHGHRRYQRGGVSLASSVGDSQEFISLRDYKPGDPLRAVHWRSFAKLGRPVVREFQDEFFVRQGLVLDTFLGARPPPVFEEAVSVAASIALSGPAHDSLLDLMFVGNQAYRFTSGRGLGQAQNMIEILACVEPATGPGFAALDALVMQNLGDTSGILCVLLDWDEARRGLFRRIGALGVPAFIFIVSSDPALAGMHGAPWPDMPLHRVAALPPGGIQEALDRCLPPATQRR